MNQKILIVGLIIGIGIMGLTYYDLNERYSELEIQHGYAVEMSKICLEDSEYCNEIKKKIFEFKNKNPMI